MQLAPHTDVIRALDVVTEDDEAPHRRSRYWPDKGPQ